MALQCSDQNRSKATNLDTAMLRAACICDQLEVSRKQGDNEPWRYSRLHMTPVNKDPETSGGTGLFISAVAYQKYSEFLECEPSSHKAQNALLPRSCFQLFSAMSQSVASAEPIN